MNLHEAHGANPRSGSGAELIVLRQHHAKHERWGHSTTVRLAHRHVREAPGSRFVHLASPQQITHEALAIPEELRRAEGNVRGRIQPWRAQRRRVDIVVPENFGNDRLPLDKYRLNP